MTTAAERLDSCAMVLFGATGDLSRRLVVPALYCLDAAGRLPAHFALIGVGRGRLSDERWRRRMRDAVISTLTRPDKEENDASLDEAVWKRFADRMTYLPADIEREDTYASLAARLHSAEQRHDTAGNVLYHLAVPPQLFASVVERLHAAGLLEESAGKDARHWRRVMIEKPFGDDLGSARELDARLHDALDERQIYRVDHFLGKSGVQSLLAVRFASDLFEAHWHCGRIDQVQITVAETLGIGARGAFYERTGCLRDMVPNHLLQLLSLAAMERPERFDAQSMHRCKADVLRALRAPASGDVVRGQYGAGFVQGDHVRAYRDEDDVDDGSVTETYVALQLFVDNRRWDGVPFYLRTGKRLARGIGEVAVHFGRAWQVPRPYGGSDASASNWLVVQIEPEDGLSLHLPVKRLTGDSGLAQARLDFHQPERRFSSDCGGYGTLLHDCMRGDRSSFRSADMVDAAWCAMQPVLDAWQGGPEPEFPNYAAGSIGPPAANGLPARQGHAWRALRPLPASAPDTPLPEGAAGAAE